MSEEEHEKMGEKEGLKSPNWDCCGVFLVLENCSPQGITLAVSESRSGA